MEEKNACLNNGWDMDGHPNGQQPTMAHCHTSMQPPLPQLHSCQDVIHAGIFPPWIAFPMIRSYSSGLRVDHLTWPCSEYIFLGSPISGQHLCPASPNTSQSIALRRSLAPILFATTQFSNGLSAVTRTTATVSVPMLPSAAPNAS